MGSVFISHSSIDQGQVRYIHDALKKAGHKVRFSSDFESGYASGADWDEQIGIELKSFDLIVYWITKRWRASPHCVGEWHVARQSVTERRQYVVQERGCDFPPTRKRVHRWTHDNKAQVLDEIFERLAEVEVKVDLTAPYPGLRPLSEDEAHLFFGREQLVRGMEARIWHRNKDDEQRRPFKVIVGPSGVGKTSILRAGLYATCHVPTRVASAGEYAIASLFDLTAPLESTLAAALSALVGVDKHLLRQELPALAQRVIDRFKQAGAIGVGARAVLFIDGFERFYDGANAPIRSMLAKVLREARVNVVASMRSDALSLLTDHDPELGPLCTPINIQPIDEDTLPDLIVRPAERAGWRVERTVIDEFLRFFANNRNGLPLVAFALRQLWNDAQRDPRAARDRIIHAGLLQDRASGEKSAIDALVSDHCSGLDERLGEDMQAPLKRLLFRVCKWEPLTGVVRPQAIVLTPGDADEESLARILCSEEFRLFTSSETSPPTVRPAHDRILDIWPRARKLVEELKPDLVLRSEMEQGIVSMLNEGRPGQLWFKERAAERLDLIQVFMNDWSAQLDNFVRAEWANYRRSLSSAARLELDTEAQIRRQIDLPRASLSGLLAQASADQSDWLLAAQFALSMGHLSTKGRRYKAIVTPIIRSLFELKEIDVFVAPGGRDRPPKLFGGTIESNPRRISAFHVRDRLIWSSPDAPPARATLVPDNHRVIETLSGAGWGCVVSAQDEQGHERDRYRPKAMFVHHPALQRPARYNLGRRDFRAAALFAGQEALTLAFAGTDAEEPNRRLIWICRLALRDLRNAPEEPRFAQLHVLDQVDFDVNTLAMSGAGPRLFAGGARYNEALGRVAAYGFVAQLNGGDGGYEMGRKTEMPELAERHSSITSVAMNRDGDRLIVGGAGGRLYFHELRSSGERSEPQLLRGVESDVGIGVRRTHTGPVTSVAFSGNGTRAFSGSTSGDIKVWDAETGAQIATLRGHTRSIEGLEVTPDGQFLASFSADGTARVWDGRALAPIGRSATLADWPLLVDCSSSDEVVAADSSGKVWRHRYRSSAQPELVADTSMRLHVTAKASDAALLLAGNDGVAIVNPKSGALNRAPMPPDTQRITAVCALDAKRGLIAASRGEPRQRETELMFVDLKSGTFQPTGVKLAAGVTLVHALSSGAVICARDDAILSVWDSRSGAVTEHAFSRHPRARLRCAVEVKELGILLTAGSFGWQYPIQVWELDPFKLRYRKEWIPGHRDQIHAMAVLGDRRTLVTAGRDCMLRFWHIEGRIQTGAVPAFPDWINALGVSPDGSIVATGGSNDRMVRTWGARPYHYSQVEWTKVDTHYSDPAVAYLANLLPKLRPHGIPEDVLNRVGLGVLASEQNRPESQEADEANDSDFGSF